MVDMSLFIYQPQFHVSLKLLKGNVHAMVSSMWPNLSLVQSVRLLKTGEAVWSCLDDGLSMLEVIGCSGHNLTPDCEPHHHYYHYYCFLSCIRSS